MEGVFLDASVMRDRSVEPMLRFNVQQDRILFEFPQGFTELRLIEECRAMNCLDVSDPDNFDMMYDITMQMITGKPVFIYYIDDKDKRHEIGKFVATDRYMNLRGVEIIDEYPVLVNWLVEFVAGWLGKKYPRSLEDIRDRMSAREERLRTSRKSGEVEVRTSF